MGRATLAWIAAAAPLTWIGCNTILGTEPPVLEGSGGQASTSTTTTTASTSSTTSTSSSTSSTSSASSSTMSTSSTGACSDQASWANWSPDQARTFDTTSPAISIDSVTHLVWEAQAKSSPDQVTYDAADGGAAAYCQGLVLANLTGWRVPDRIELASLVDFTLPTPPLLDATAFPSTPKAVFWTSTPFLPAGGDNWVVSFIDGTLAPAGVATINAVRCVHDPVSSDAGAPPCQRYDLSTPNTALDRGTGLHWQLHADTSKYTGDSQAAGVCSSLPGGTWRMPTLEELLTLVDDARQGPALDPTVFAGEPVGRYWSSTPFAPPPAQGQWFVDFTDGQSNRMVTANPAYVRCVQP